MQRKLFPRYISRRHGFTLVELMIAIAVSAILLLGVVQVFVYSRHAYTLDNALADAQENARFAVHTLSEDIRMAGYVGCQASNVANTLNNQTQWMYDFNTPLQGWNAGSTSYPLPTSFSTLGVVNGTDVIVVLRGGNTAYQITQVNGNGAQSSASFELNTAVGLSQFDIVMVSDCSQASIFQITNDPSTNASHTTDHQTGNGTPGNCTKNLGSPIPQGCVNGDGTNYAYGLNASMLKMIATAYYIGTTAAGTSALFRVSLNQGQLGQPQELAEGVENMQIRYGVDTTGDGLANQYIDADALRSKIAGGFTQGFDAVVSVRLGLLVDTTSHALKTLNNLTYTLDGNIQIKGGTGGPAADQHPIDYKLRFPITTTIKLRNRGAM